MKDKILNLTEKKYFYEIYCLVIMIVSFISWSLLPIVGLTILMLLVAFMLFFTNDIKFILPGIINFIFTIGEAFQSNSVPVSLMIVGFLLIISIVVYLIRNKIKFSFGRYGICFLLLAIAAVIPIFWSILREYKEQSFMYLLYFNWFLYLIIYAFIVSCVKEDLKKELSISLSYLGCLIVFECILKGIEGICNGEGLLDLYFSLGWGICNEAGIMILVCLPFVFYLIHVEEIKLKIINGIKVLLMIFGIILTTSRATYVMGSIEIVLLFFLTSYLSKERKKIIPVAIFVIIGVAVGILASGVLDEIMAKVFKLGFGLNGREYLYKDAIKHFTKNPLTIIFGDGIVNEFEVVHFSNRIDSEVGTLRMIVYHSTFFQTLATMGCVGLALMLYHFILKYMFIFKKISIYKIYTFIGFVCVDLYGFIDNTYHMYYYMIILVIILGINEKENFVEERLDMKGELNYEQIG